MILLNISHDGNISDITQRVGDGRYSQQQLPHKISKRWPYLHVIGAFVIQCDMKYLSKVWYGRNIKQAIVLVPNNLFTLFFILHNSKLHG